VIYPQIYEDRESRTGFTGLTGYDEGKNPRKCLAGRSSANLLRDLRMNQVA